VVVVLVKFILPKKKKEEATRARKRYRVVTAPEGGVVVETLPDDGSRPPRPRKPAFSGQGYFSPPTQGASPPRRAPGAPREGSFTSIGRVAPTPSQSHGSFSSTGGKVAPAPEPLLTYHQFQADRPHQPWPSDV
jgi:hypothetical protein